MHELYGASWPHVGPEGRPQLHLWSAGLSCHIGGWLWGARLVRACAGLACAHADSVLALYSGPLVRLPFNTAPHRTTPACTLVDVLRNP